MPDWYLRMAATTGSSFVPAWSNADVAIVAIVVFAVFFVIATLTAREWPTDVAFLSLVAGGILVAWPAMIALTIGAVFLAMLVSMIHRVVAPERTARIAAEAERRAAPAVEALARDLGISDEERRRILAAKDDARDN